LSHPIIQKMSGVNKVILVGNLGKDPEVKYLESKVPVAKFSLATNAIWKDKEGNRQEHTEWHNVVVWRGAAEFAENYLRKGDLVYVEGKLKTRSWDDKDNIKRYTTEVVADTLNRLSGKREEDGAPPANPSESASTPIPTSEPPTDDLPF